MLSRARTSIRCCATWKNRHESPARSSPGMKGFSHHESALDWIRSGASQFRQAGLCIGHHADNPIDEARTLVLHALGLPEQTTAELGQARLLASEHQKVAALLDRRILERAPAAYLIGHASFAGRRFLCDARALVPRSPMAELIERGFTPWFARRAPERVLDLCCGGRSIGIATALQLPHSRVDLLDLSPDALQLARENVALHGVQPRVSLLQSDLFAALADQRYDLILSNPPYLTRNQYRALPKEYSHEPEMALVSGQDGLDHPLRILAGAAAHLAANGWLVLEVGEAQRALRRLLPALDIAWIQFTVMAFLMAIFSVSLWRYKRRNGDVSHAHPAEIHLMQHL